MHCVYVIRNLINDKVYVGQTKNFANRKYGHLYDARSGCDRPLYRSMRKHGVENFVFEILEECEADMINEREQHWVAHFDSFNPEKGYNLTSGGSFIGERTTKESTKLKLSKLFSGERNPAYGRRGTKHPLYGKPGTMLGKKCSKESVAKRVASVKENGSFVGENNGMFGRTGEKCPVAKLTQVQADEIRERLKTEKISFKKLGQEYGVSRFTVSRINDGIIYVSNL